MFALKLVAPHLATSEPWDPGALLEEESRLELLEALAAARLAQLDQRAESTLRALDDRRGQLEELAVAGAGLLDTLRSRLQQGDAPETERGRCARARRAAIEARQALLEAEHRRAEQREAALTAAESAVASTDRDLQRRTEERAARRAEQTRLEEKRSSRRSLEPRPAAPAEPAGGATLEAERRRHRRASLETQVDLASDSNFYSGFSSDLSDGGIFVATCQLLPAGTVVDLSFTLPGGEAVIAQGVVRWSREPNDATPEIFPGLGVEFVEMSEEHRRAVHAFTAEREPLFWCD